MRTKTLIALLATMILTAPAWASTSSTPSAARDSEFPSSSQVTKTVTVVVKEVGADNKLRLFDVRSEEELVIQLADTVKVKAQDKTAFDGRKKLEVSDLAKGQRLKMTYRTDDGQILQVKVLKRG